MSIPYHTHIQTALERLDATGGQPEGSSIQPGFRQRILHLLHLLRATLFPTAFANEGGADRYADLSHAADTLLTLLEEVMPQETPARRVQITTAFIDALPEVAETLHTDVQAAYEGDPAARSATEIMLAYPAFEAISIYRLAHVLYTAGVPLLPRMMTEHAHRNTGIDIHPGATIGPSFFIDHGTGVVIGETCHIGAHVKLYQGVTLGAKSFELDADGNPVKGIKRHPDIGDRVVIYANATILGGQTHIGSGSVIGGNVWLTHSVPENSTVYYNGNSAATVAPPERS